LESSDFFPDLVLLDYQLGPGQTGDVVSTRRMCFDQGQHGPRVLILGAPCCAQVCKEMRRVFGSAPVPIIMCSAMGERSSAMDACRAAGATDVLLKPYEREAIIAKIEQHCGHKV
jgi:DNA-binding response OmpR family regulator